MERLPNQGSEGLCNKTHEANGIGTQGPWRSLEFILDNSEEHGKRGRGRHDLTYSFKRFLC